MVHTHLMNRLTPIAFASLTAALMALPGASAHAQYYAAEPQPVQFERPGNERPMPMIRNDARIEHRRQGAKCMNAYPEDHGAFSTCIKSEREGSRFHGNRRQLMPMPPGE